MVEKYMPDSNTPESGAPSPTPSKNLFVRSPEYDPGRKDYQVTQEDREIVWTDPLTGKEVARHPRVEGGAIALEMELNPAGKGPEEIVDIMQRISVMDFQRREEHNVFYQPAADSLQEFAQKDKLLGTDAEVVKKERLKNDVVSLRGEITAMTTPAFLEHREVIQKQIEDVKLIRENAIKAEEEKEAREQQAEPEKWEKDIERDLLQSESIRPPLPVPPADRSFSSQLGLLEQDPNSVNAKEELSWYLHEAREMGIVEDLEEKLDHKYREWATSILPRYEYSQRDDSMIRVSGRSITDVEDEIIEYFDTLLLERFDNNSIKTNPQYVEQPARWNILQRRGVSSADIQRL